MLIGWEAKPYPANNGLRVVSDHGRPQEKPLHVLDTQKQFSL